MVLRKLICDASQIAALTYYVNGLSAVLGQWHTAGVSQYSSIYNSGTTSSTNICFRMITSRKRKLVTYINFSEDTTEAAPNEY